MRVVIMWSLLFLLFAVMPEGALAASEKVPDKEPLTLETVVVKAEKRSAEAQKVPASMTVLEQSDIQDMGIDGMSDLAEHVPNLEFHDFGSRKHGLLFLRGIKSLPAGQSGTGFNVDGVSYIQSYMFGFPLFDVDRIEVLRGAQGTLYGRNTTGGVINIYTARPGNEFASTAGTTFGNYGTRELRANCSGPLIEDKLFLGIYGLASSENGFMENDIETGGDDGRNKEGKAGRVKLRYKASDDWEMTLSLDGQHHDDGAYSSRRTERNGYVQSGTFSADDRYHYSHDFEGSQDVDFWGAGLDSEWKTTMGTVQSITGYRGYDSIEWIDADFSPLDYMRKRFLQKDKNFSQEFRMTSPEDGGPLKWITGLYLYHFDSETIVGNHFGSASPNPGMEVRFDTVRRNTGSAVFGEATYAVLPRFDLTLGLRGEYEHAKGASTRTNILANGMSSVTSAFDRQENYTALLPKLSLAWHFTDEVMTYAAVAKAHKNGGFNDASAPHGDEGYGEEESWLYEVGVKSFAFDKRLMVNVAAFYTTIDNEQLSLYQASVKQGYLANAGKSHRTGIELESRFKLASAWTLSGNASWIDARFDEYEDPVLGVDYAGERVFCVPEYSYELALDYRDRIAADCDLFGRVGLSGVGPQYFDNANTVRQAAYELVNMRLGFQWKQLECSLWAKNLFDRYYVAFENTTAGIAEDGKLRTFGVSVDYTF
ncbi:MULTISPECIES: TonB-dependent receptor [unclassified Pseudodesulfovibrio]|uniref:TonB-dependent receptor n=1 Tax=unclassified Pseudodesulfovibrio TaxID=2661612 RepID=UPI000FEC0E70|nr:MULTISPECIES: TonB-dependent receptor [unclassified Pseudodesulfovibrio]MCJ2163531.1 TonB-dependent receptor [Pseudodesulfovibrio sp. S3-i]RWU06767.1 TonB-dependent receptor [Pseudodesulfovibrio sp. S3]